MGISIGTTAARGRIALGPGPRCKHRLRRYLHPPVLLAVFGLGCLAVSVYHVHARRAQGVAAKESASTDRPASEREPGGKLLLAGPADPSAGHRAAGHEVSTAAAIASVEPPADPPARDRTVQAARQTDPPWRGILLARGPPAAA